MTASTPFGRDGQLGRMLVMGRIAGAHAVRGWVKIKTFTRDPDGLLSYPSWWVGRDGAWREVMVEEAAVHGGGLIAKIAGCEDRDAAVALKGLEVSIPREQLPEGQADEYYWADLQGLQVRNLEGATLGVVTGLMETGANQVLVVEAERERLIPFVAAVVKSVDLAQGSMVVDWGVDF